MSRESKIFSVHSKEMLGERIKEYEAFGWELLSINGLDVSMSRETQNVVYPQLVKFEFEYNNLREKLDNISFPALKAPFNFALMFLLLLLFIVPGIFYIKYKLDENKKFLNTVETHKKEIIELQNKITETCNESRALFFSKNN